MTAADPAEAPPRGPVARLAGALALAGGLVLLATAGLTTVSVLLRWTLSRPVPGDFELVSLGAALTVLLFLAHGTAMRANILVDAFTGFLPRRATRAIDALWSLVWAAAALLLAERMVLGAFDTWRSGTTTMVLSLPTWWAVAVGAVCYAATGLAALYWALRLARGGG